MGSGPSRILRRSVVAGAAIYVAIDVVLHFLRPDLSLTHNPESDYGNGPYAWLMDVNFEIRMLLSVACVAVLWRAWTGGAGQRIGCALIAVWAVASGILGFVPDDPMGASPTVHGTVHLVVAALGFIAALTGLLCLTVSLWRQHSVRMPRWPPALLAGIAFVSLLALGHAGFGPHTLGGIYERTFLAAVLAWMAVLCGWPPRSRDAAGEAGPTAPLDRRR